MATSFACVSDALTQCKEWKVIENKERERVSDVVSPTESYLKFMATSKF